MNLSGNFLQRKRSMHIMAIMIRDSLRFFNFAMVGIATVTKVKMNNHRNCRSNIFEQQTKETDWLCLVSAGIENKIQYNNFHYDVRNFKSIEADIMYKSKEYTYLVI